MMAYLANAQEFTFLIQFNFDENRQKHLNANVPF